MCVTPFFRKVSLFAASLREPIIRCGRISEATMLRILWVWLSVEANGEETIGIPGDSIATPADAIAAVSGWFRLSSDGNGAAGLYTTSGTDTKADSASLKVSNPPDRKQQGFSARTSDLKMTWSGFLPSKLAKK